MSVIDKLLYFTRGPSAATTNFPVQAATGIVGGVNTDAAVLQNAAVVGGYPGDGRIDLGAQLANFEGTPFFVNVLLDTLYPAPAAETTVTAFDISLWGTNTATGTDTKTKIVQITQAVSGIASYNGTGALFASLINTYLTPDLSGVIKGLPIQAMIPNLRAFPYAAGTAYALADVVSYLGSTYVSLQAANTGNTPSTSPTFWTRVTGTFPFRYLTVEMNVVGTGITAGAPASGTVSAWITPIKEGNP